MCAERWERADKQRIRSFIANVKKLRQAGVRGPALAEALGNPDYAAQLAAMSPAELSTYRSEFSQRETLLKSAAAVGSRAVGVDAQGGRPDAGAERA